MQILGETLNRAGLEIQLLQSHNFHMFSTIGLNPEQSKNTKKKINHDIDQPKYQREKYVNYWLAKYFQGWQKDDLEWANLEVMKKRMQIQSLQETQSGIQNIINQENAKKAEQESKNENQMTFEQFVASIQRRKGKKYTTRLRELYEQKLQAALNQTSDK